MDLTRTHKLGLAGIAVLAIAAAGLGTTLALNAGNSTRHVASRSVAERTATSPSTTTTTVAPVAPDAAAVPPVTSPPAAKPAAAPSPAPAPAPAPGPGAPALGVIKIDPGILGKLQLPDIAPPSIKVTGLVCGNSFIRVFFTVTDESSISGLTAVFTSANGFPNPPMPLTIAGISPNKYKIEFNPVPNTTNALTIKATDAANNSGSSVTGNVCI